jgi:hypothetical protein
MSNHEGAKERAAKLKQPSDDTKYERGAGVCFVQGRAVQVDPIKPTLKPPGTKRLKPHYDKPLSTFAFKLNVRRHTKGQRAQALGFSSSGMGNLASSPTTMCCPTLLPLNTPRCFSSTETVGKTIRLSDAVRCSLSKCSLTARALRRIPVSSTPINSTTHWCGLTTKV